ncbi:sirohydrochlorin chelatase [Bacillus sp. JJ1764]|uniref:sirohydrochlorin chelatase n=1 Tax=Bacillus sp. JJ1764 TaxID=3122964 RepID=UPI00300050CA
MNAIIYVAHGSRRAKSNDLFVTFIQKVMATSQASIKEYGFLEHEEPSVNQAVNRCIQQGADQITVVPVFLAPGIHVNQDIPDILRSISGVEFHLARPLGVDEIMVEILADRLKETQFDKEAAVLLVGHGSRNAQAAIETECLAQRLKAKISHPVQIGYMTTSQFYHEKARELMDQTIYILPYFLFTGGYTVKMKRELEKLGGDFKFCRPVGFDEKLIPLIQKRASEVEHVLLSDYVTA